MTDNQILNMTLIFFGASLALVMLVCLAIVVGHAIGAIAEWFVPGSRLLKAERKREKTLAAVFGDNKAFRIVRGKRFNTDTTGIFQVYSTGKRKVFLARFSNACLQPGTRTTEWAAIKIRKTWYPIHSMWTTGNELKYEFIRNSDNHPSLIMMALHAKIGLAELHSNDVKYWFPLKWKATSSYGGHYLKDGLESAVEKVIHDNVFTVDEIYTMYSNPDLFREQMSDPSLEGIPLEFIQHMYNLPVDSLWGINPQSKMLSPAN
jgi:hypothetical protein